MEHELGLKTKPDDWMLATLGEYLDSTGGSIQTGPFGSQLHASDYVEVGSPSVMPKNISVEGINTDDIAKVSDDDMQRLSKYHLESGDIVYSRRGDVEKCALVKEQEAGWLCGTGCLRVRLGSSDNAVSAEFLHAYLSSPMIREWISRNAVGATMPNLNTGILRDVPLLLPSVKEAKGIGKSWATLNNKIALNRQINQTLEQMAQTLFKSWFVDFDPVMDNALDAGNPIPDELQHRAEVRKAVRESEGFKPLPEDVRQLFPDAFEESELGWVPKGWKVSTYGEHMDFQNGFAFKSKELLDNDASAYPVFKMGHIKRGGGFNPQGTKSYFPIECVDKKIAKYFALKGDLLMSMTDMKSNMVILGNTALMPVDNVFLQNQRVARLRPKTSSHLNYSYLYFYSNEPQVVDELRSRANSGVQVNLTSGAIKDTLLLVPAMKAHAQFDATVRAYLEKSFSLDSETEMLMKLRDTLLPKLISGELRLDDIELAVEQEAVSAEQQNER